MAELASARVPDSRSIAEGGVLLESAPRSIAEDGGLLELAPAANEESSSACDGVPRRVRAGDRAWRLGGSIRRESNRDRFGPGALNCGREQALKTVEFNEKGMLSNASEASNLRCVRPRN